VLGALPTPPLHIARRPRQRRDPVSRWGVDRRHDASASHVETLAKMDIALVGKRRAGGFRLIGGVDKFEWADERRF